MSECKAKVIVEICAETAVDAVSKRVAKGMKVIPACKEVADEFNRDNDATVTWKSLRTSYYRAQNCSSGTVSKKEKSVPLEQFVKKLDVPMIGVTPKEQDHIDLLKEACKKLRAKNELLKTQVHELQTILLEYDKKPQQQNNKDFIEEFKEEREERIKEMRVAHGYNEDGTPMSS